MSLAELRDNTEHFLRNNLVVIGSGPAASKAGPSYFKIEIRTATGGGFSITKLGAKPVQDSPNVFEAWYIPMEQVSGFSANRLPAAGESPLRLMLTSQLTACLFAVGNDGQNTTVAHIQPDWESHKDIVPEPAPLTLDRKAKDYQAKKQEFEMKKAYRDGMIRDFRQSDLRMAARVKGLKTFVSQLDSAHQRPWDGYTTGYDNASGKGETVAIVGIRDNAGHWRIFAQVANKDKTIKEVTKS